MPEKTANRMVLTLPSATEIVVTRTFDAPRRLVFEAMTRCEHLAKWWGPRGFELTECSIDLRPGGTYRYVQRAPDGGIHPFYGVWREIAPERIVCTQTYEPFPTSESVVTSLLTEHDGRTTLSQHVAFSSAEARDAAIAAGMEWGEAQAFERLDELLAELGSSNR